MSKSMRKIHSAAFKLKVVLESYRPDLTIAQVSSQYKVHSTQIHQWKRKFKEDGPNIFSHKKDPKISEMREEKDDLYRQIGQLTVENDWLKKKSELLAS
jgi:transposase